MGRVRPIAVGLQRFECLSEKEGVMASLVGFLPLPGLEGRFWRAEQRQKLFTS